MVKKLKIPLETLLIKNKKWNTGLRLIKPIVQGKAIKLIKTIKLIKQLTLDS
jgi:hypothetical protein